jgi:hypothetical protein
MGLDRTHEILHGDVAGFVDTLHQLQDMMRIAVNDGHTNVIVIFVLSKKPSVLCSVPVLTAGGARNMNSRRVAKIQWRVYSASRISSTLYSPDKYRS